MKSQLIDTHQVSLFFSFQVQFGDVLVLVNPAGWNKNHFGHNRVDIVMPLMLVMKSLLHLKVLLDWADWFGVGFGSSLRVTAESEQVNKTIRLVSESETSMIDVLRGLFTHINVRNDVAVSLNNKYIINYS